MNGTALYQGVAAVFLAQVFGIDLGIGAMLLIVVTAVGAVVALPVEAARQPNLWICLCGPHMRGMEIFCQRADPDRLLWGTDYGFSFSDPMEYRLALIHRAKIGDRLRERILAINPMRLLEGDG